MLNHNGAYAVGEDDWQEKALTVKNPSVGFSSGLSHYLRVSRIGWAALALITGCSTLPSSYEMRLADHLSATGAKMYGAYWCPHCATQKDDFGGAVNHIPYIECDSEGFDAQPELCQAEGIEAYPTWVIGGDRYLGTQTLGKLARLSGFEQPAVKDEVSPAPGGYSVPE